MSQCTQIAAHLQKGHRLTVLSAIHHFGCYALSQRCGELRRKGWPITSRLVTLPSGKRVAQYRLKKGAKCPTP